MVGQEGLVTSRLSACSLAWKSLVGAETLKTLAERKEGKH